jgi:hypothetical protein
MHQITITLLSQDDDISAEQVATGLAMASASLSSGEEIPVVQDGGGFDLFIQEVKQTA